MQLYDTLVKGEFPDSLLERMAEDDAKCKNQFLKIMEGLAEIKEGLDKLNVRLVPDHVLSQLKQYATSERSSDSDSTVISSDLEGNGAVDSGAPHNQHASSKTPSNRKENERVHTTVPEHQHAGLETSVPDDNSEDMFHFETDFTECDPNLNANNTVKTNARTSGNQGPSNTASGFNLNTNINCSRFLGIHSRFPITRSSRLTNDSFQFDQNQSPDTHFHRSSFNHNISLPLMSPIPPMPSIPSLPILPSPPSSLFDVANRHSSYDHSNNSEDAAERAKEVDDLENHIDALRTRETAEHEKYLDMLRAGEAKSMVKVQKEITDLVHTRIVQAEAQLKLARLRVIMP